MQWIPIHSIANALHRNDIDTIAMDIYGLIARGVAAAGGRVTGAIRPDWCENRGQTAAGRDFSSRRGQANDGCNARLRTSVRRAIM